VAVMDACESGVLDLPDFYFTGDDYRYRFDPEAKQRFLELLRERFNSPVRYKGRVLKWDTVIQEKTEELARYLNGRMQRLGFTEPTPILERTDARTIREAILGFTQSEAKKRGIENASFYYLRRNARNAYSFRVYRKVRKDFLDRVEKE